MATTTKKDSKNKKPILRRAMAKTSEAKQAEKIAELRRDLEARNRDLAECLEREKAALKDLQVRDQQLAESLQREKATAKELQERNAELREALEHQTATSEVLGIISRSPTDVQPVLDAIVESAARVCGIDDVTLRLRDGEFMVWRTHFGPIPTIRSDKISLDEPQYRWMREHGALHIFRTSARRTISQPWVPLATGEPI
jgi:hypothetical protein